MPEGPIQTVDHRVRPGRVLRNLQALSPGSPFGLGIGDDLALLAGCIDVLDAGEGDVERRVADAVRLVGDEYAAGFRDGFNRERVSGTANQRYAEGLQDGYAVGHVVRHGSVAEQSAVPPSPKSFRWT